jgi:hypothetical protein
MRKVTSTIVDAFCNRRPRKCGNTHTDGNIIYLFGNAIAKWEDSKLFITLAGHNTRTTRERLNGLGSRNGFGVYSHRSRPHISLIKRGEHQEFLGWDAHVEMPCNEWIQPHEYAVKYGTDQ